LQRLKTGKRSNEELNKEGVGKAFQLAKKKMGKQALGRKAKRKTSIKGD